MIATAICHLLYALPSMTKSSNIWWEQCFVRPTDILERIALGSYLELSGTSEVHSLRQSSFFDPTVGLLFLKSMNGAKKSTLTMSSPSPKTTGSWIRRCHIVRHLVFSSIHRTEDSTLWAVFLCCRFVDQGAPHHSEGRISEKRRKCPLCGNQYCLCLSWRALPLLLSAWGYGKSHCGAQESSQG